MKAQKGRRIYGAFAIRRTHRVRQLRHSTGHPAPARDSTSRGLQWTERSGRPLNPVRCLESTHLRLGAWALWVILAAAIGIRAVYLARTRAPSTPLA